MSLRDLPDYEKFRNAVEQLCIESNSIREFSNQLKNDIRFKQLRNMARKELQSIYNDVRRDLKLPQIPVYLPVRKKVRTRGQAHATGSSPTEIRVYPVEGPAGVSYHDWLPQQITICSKLKTFEIFKHEIAHIITTHRNGIMDDHDEAFVTAYDEINTYFKSNGFSSLIDSSLELWGVPPMSYAAQVAESRGIAWTCTSTGVGTGCLVSGIALILAATLILLVTV